MSSITLVSSFLRFVRDSGLAEVVGPREVILGLRHVRTRFGQIAMDAHAAEVAGVPFSEAVDNDDEYPHMTRFFAQMGSFLQSVPAPLIGDWLERYLSGPEVPIVDVLRGSLVAQAASPEATPARALPRFLIFVGVWMNLRLLYLRDPAGMVKQGLAPELLAPIAEDVMREWLADPIPAEHGFRPYNIMVAAAVGTLPTHADEFRSAVRLSLDEIGRAEAEAVFAKMVADDAILLRNAAAETFGDARRDVDHLRRLHPESIGMKSRAALDKQLQRIRDRFRRDGVRGVVARDRRVVDIVFGAAAPSEDL